MSPPLALIASSAAFARGALGRVRAAGPERPPGHEHVRPRPVQAVLETAQRAVDRAAELPHRAPRQERHVHRTRAALVDPLRQLLRLRGRELRVGVGVDVDRVALPRLHGGVDRAVLRAGGRRDRQDEDRDEQGDPAHELAAGGVRPAHGPERQHVAAGLRGSPPRTSSSSGSSSAIRLESAFSASAIGSGR